MSDSNLCALRKGSAFFRREFPPTDFVCNSLGDLVHFDGPYDVEKHRLAYERAKKWVYDGEWRARPGMKPFRRLFSDQIDASNYRAFDVSDTMSWPDLSVKEPCWTGGLPPVCVGMLGTYKKRKAVVVSRVVRTEVDERLVGIGDPECMFKDYESQNRVRYFGLSRIPVRRVYWRVMTPSCDVELPVTSTMFHRSTQVIKNFEDRGAIRALKYMVDPVKFAAEYSSPPCPLETKEPLAKIPRKMWRPRKRAKKA